MAPPVAEQHRLLAVHAHPDDESITTGGLLARCTAAGMLTALVTCTDGRHGPVNPELGLDLQPDQLAEVRATELRAATRILGVSRLEWLGWHDSGMTGSPHNDAPLAFWSQPFELLLGPMVRILRSFRPHIVVTYDPFGGTGHPDHIQAHRVTLLATEAAADTHAFASEGAPWTAVQVFYPVFPGTAMERLIEEDLRAGRPHPFDGRPITEINYVRRDELVTHRVRIRAVYERKRDALHAHRTQVGPHYPQLYRAALARREHEHYRLARGAAATMDVSDLFEPVGW